MKFELERNLAGLFRDYDSARVTVQQYKNEMLPRAEQAYRMYQTNYQRMAATPIAPGADFAADAVPVGR